MNDELQTLLRSADPEPHTEPYDDAARSRLLQRAVGLEPPLRRAQLGRRLAIGGAVAAAGAVAITVAASLFSGPVASAGIELTRDGDFYLVRITEPDRDSAELTAALKAKGLNITLETGPVSPSLVGSITEMGFSEGTVAIGELSPSPCLVADGCEVGLRVPVDFEGEAWIGIGRAAKPGEEYGSVASLVDPGELFACVDLRGRLVPDVVAHLRAAGLEIIYRGGPEDTQEPVAYEELYVEDVLPLSATRAFVFAQVDPPSAEWIMPDGC